MPKLYVANCTTQNHSFQYRFEGNPRIYSFDVRAGGQDIVFDGPQDRLEAIIRQKEGMGFAAAVEASRIRVVTGLLWSVDKPVTPTQMMVVAERNAELLTKQAAQRREEAAIAVAVKSDRDTGHKVASLELDVVEEMPRERADATPFQHGVKVSTAATGRSERPRRRAA